MPKSTEPTRSLRPQSPRRPSGLTSPQKALTLIVAAYVLCFFGMAKRCYDVFGYDSGGTGYSNNMMWWTVHGRPYYSAGITTAKAVGPTNALAIHAPFFWLFLIPIYALAPYPTSLLLLQSAALGLAAIPVFLIVRWALKDEWVAVTLAAAFIFLPPVVSQNLNQVQEPSFLPVVLLFAFLFFLQQRFGLFLLWAFLSCLNRENVPLAVVMFGTWALLERRGWRWVVGPVALGVTYFVVVVFVVMPSFRTGEYWHVTDQFSYLGASLPEIVLNMFRRPSLLYDHLSRAECVQYVIFLIQPLAWFLPFGSCAWLPAAPDLMINLLSENNALRVIGWHYNLLTSSGLFVGMVMTLRKWTGPLGRWSGNASHVRVMAFGLLALAVAHWFLWFQPRCLRERPNHDALVRAVASVPPDASVLAPARVVAHFSSRPLYDYIGIWQSHPNQASKFDYVMLDAQEGQFPPAITQEFFDSFNKNPSYELAFADNGVFLFRRRDHTEGK